MLAFLTFSGAIALAQPTKKAWMLGGNLGLTFNQLPDNDISTRQLDLLPQVYRFVTDRLGVGVQSSFRYTSTSIDGQWNNSSLGYIVGPAARYYLGNSAFRPLGEVTFGMGRNNLVSKTLVGDQTITFRENLVNWSAGAGVGWFISPKVSLEGLLKFNQLNQKEVNNNNASRNQNSLDFQIGFMVLIP